MTSVAIDGGGATGKSTLLHMIEETSDAKVFKPSKDDLFKASTKEIRKLLNLGLPTNLIAQLVSGGFPEQTNTIKQALSYAQDFPNAKGEAMLAYMFREGRLIISPKITYLSQNSDILLDRWDVSGRAYQMSPPNYTDEDIKKINIGIYRPDVQVIVTSPIEDLISRMISRGYGNQLFNREQREQIQSNFLEIHRTELNFYLVENNGKYIEPFATQILQIIPAYVELAGILNQNGIPVEIPSTSFWKNPAVLDRIYQKQHS